MKCKYCNADVEQNARFCTTCGKDLSIFDKCIGCGELIDKGTLVCPYCGREQPEVVEQTSSKKWIWAVVCVLLVALIGGGYYYLSQNEGKTSGLTEAVDSDSIAVVDTEYDIHSIDGIKARLDEILKNSLSMDDESAIKKYFSQDFQQINRKVEEFDAKLEGPGFWCGNIWDGGQDGNPNGFTINSVNSSTETEAYADVKFSYDMDEYHSATYVPIVLVFENGNWYIDSVDRNKDGMKEYVSESGNTSGNTTTSNGTYSMAGKVSKYAIHMNIEINGSDANGYYYYDSQGIGNKVKLSGSIKEGGELTLKKFSNDGEETGYFEGLFNGVEYSGKNVNYNRDKDLQFSVTVE